jgi:hypothetical protein
MGTGWRFRKPLFAPQAVPRLFLISAFLVLTAVPALADDDVKTLIATCGAPDLPPDKLDDCLEQVRVAAETDGSPELPALEAQLEQRRAHPQPDAQTNSPADTEAPAASGEDAGDADDDKRDTGAVGQPVLHPYDPDASQPPDGR